MRFSERTWRTLGRMAVGVVTPAIPAAIWYKYANDQRHKRSEEVRTRVRLPNVQTVDDSKCWKWFFVIYISWAATEFHIHNASNLKLLFCVSANDRSYGGKMSPRRCDSIWSSSRIVCSGALVCSGVYYQSKSCVRRWWWSSSVSRQWEIWSLW